MDIQIQAASHICANILKVAAPMKRERVTWWRDGQIKELDVTDSHEISPARPMTVFYNWEHFSDKIWNIFNNLKEVQLSNCNVVVMICSWLYWPSQATHVVFSYNIKAYIFISSKIYF